MNLSEVTFTPAEAQKLWDISPGMFNSYRSRGQLDMTQRKAGKHMYSGFDVIQMTQLGIQMKLVKEFYFPLTVAKIMAAEAAEEFERHYESISPNQRNIPNMPYVVVPGDPPKWFKVGLNDTFSKIDERVGSTQWVVLDVQPICDQVFNFMIDKAGDREKYERAKKREKTKGN